MGKSVAELQKELWVWQQKNFPNHDYAGRDENLIKRLKYGIVEETGEFYHAILKGVQGIRGSAADHNLEAKDSLGDALVYCLNWASAADQYVSATELENAAKYYSEAEKLIEQFPEPTEFSINHSLHSGILACDCTDVFISIICLGLYFGYDYKECLGIAAEEAMSRDWIKFPYNGKTDVSIRN